MNSASFTPGYLAYIDGHGRAFASPASARPASRHAAPPSPFFTGPVRAGWRGGSYLCRGKLEGSFGLMRYPRSSHLHVASGPFGSSAAGISDSASMAGTDG